MRLTLLVAAFLGFCGTMVIPTLALEVPSGDSAIKPGGDTFVISPCSTPITGGKASLIIGALQPHAETYVGSYTLKVSPYFFMNETGSLSMTLSQESVRKLDQGIEVVAVGQAVTKKNGKTRTVNATLTPTTKDEGAVTFKFTGENTKLTFKSAYKRQSN